MTFDKANPPSVTSFPPISRSSKPSSAWLRGLVLALAFAGPGCFATQPWINNHESAPPVCQVHAFWDSRIHETQDVVNNGRTLHGLAGRVYVFTSEFGVPEKGDGSVAVDLYDVSNPQPGTAPKLLERWQIDPGNLSKLIRKDKIGWGYTLFLPWSTYNPEITRVQLNVCYMPAKGTPLYTEPTTISLRNQITSSQSRQLALPTGGSLVKQ